MYFVQLSEKKIDLFPKQNNRYVFTKAKNCVQCTTGEFVYII